MICQKAGLINVPWDGYLKYFRPSERFVEERRKIFASSLISRYSHLNLVELEKQFTQEDEHKRKKATEKLQGKTNSSYSQ